MLASFMVHQGGIGQQWKRIRESHIGGLEDSLDLLYRLMQWYDIHVPKRADCHDVAIDVMRNSIDDDGSGVAFVNFYSMLVTGSFVCKGATYDSSCPSKHSTPLSNRAHSAPLAK